MTDPRTIPCYVDGEEAEMGYLTTRDKDKRREEWRSGLNARADARKADAKAADAKAQAKKDARRGR